MQEMKKFSQVEESGSQSRQSLKGGKIVNKEEHCNHPKMLLKDGYEENEKINN